MMLLTRYAQIEQNRKYKTEQFSLYYCILVCVCIVGPGDDEMTDCQNMEHFNVKLESLTPGAPN